MAIFIQAYTRLFTAESHVLLLLQLRKLDDDKNIRFAFDCLDTDKSNYLSRDEIVVALQNFQIPESEIDEIVETVDANRDGKIDFPEFRAMIRGNC